MNPVDYQPPIQHLTTVLQSPGFALWQTQSLENTLVHYLVLVHKVPAGTARERVEQVFEATHKNTLGQLIKDLGTHEGSKTDLATRLSAFNAERRWLVHRSRHTSHTDLFDAAKTRALTERLDRLAGDALTLMSEIQVALERSLERVGVTREFIEAKSREILKSWAEVAPPEPAS